jgi:hypothetical protein
MGEARLHRCGVLRRAAPFQRLGFLGAAGLQRAGEFNQALCWISAICTCAIEHDILDPFTQFRREVVIHAHHAGVDDAHGHAGLDGVVQEHGVDGFTCRVVAAEREAHIRHTA